MHEQKFYSIGEAADLAGTTIETLRHYDRIGLLKPAKVDSESRYRYYTDTELIYMEVISFCRKNKMPLAEIKGILNADFPKVISFLESAENNIGIEIQRLCKTRRQISALRQSLQEYSVEDYSGPCIKFFAQRAIILADELHDASVENFRRLHNDIYQALEPSEREEFTFDNSANFLICPPKNLVGTMFAVCTKYCSHPSVRLLKAGNYLCCNCTEKNKDEAILSLWNKAKEICRENPEFVILNVQFVGLFQWRFEIQIPVV